MTEEERKQLQNDLRELHCAHTSYTELLTKVCEIGRRIRRKCLELERKLDEP